MKPFICGNWKMHKTVEEALSLVKELLVILPHTVYEKVDVAVAPSFTNLYPVYQVISGTPVALSAQNVYFEKEGAFTGEVSVDMLKSAGCSYCIVGHSERRRIFGETDEWVNLKVRALKDAGLIPILCVGETLEERESGKTLEVIERQLNSALEGVDIRGADELVVAYEPVWAIGTGKVATPSQAQEVHAFIRQILEGLYKDLAKDIRLLYGGSVKPDNVSGLVKERDIDGALVGGASLKAQDFAAIVINTLEVV
ncbi:MAG: triose-phosphate isomerase [Deferribacteres bacterium]|nr:triose-phosphate isomerase [Deferribacteres bacterium]